MEASLPVENGLANAWEVGGGEAALRGLIRRPTFFSRPEQTTRRVGCHFEV